MLDNLIYWNCRGIGSSKVRLRAMLKVLKPTVLIVAEPFRQDCKLERWQGMLKFDASYSNGDSDGKLWIFWNNEVHINILQDSNQHVTFIINSSFLFLLFMLNVIIWRDGTSGMVFYLLEFFRCLE